MAPGIRDDRPPRLGPGDEPAPDFPPARRRIFATLGTHLPWARSRWRAGLEAIARDRPDWLIVASEGRMEGEMVRFDGPLNLIVVARLCYVHDLSQFDAVIHHGGTGIAYSAIAAGLPSLVVPHDFDQFDMAARIVWHGLGLRTGSLAGAVNLLDRLVEEDWPALPRFQAAAARHDPQSRFLAAVDRVTRSA
jgi:UDP:flavonoid glycosyltransferase YjiC (YdhE family)